jgi:hypothetical protein
MSETAMASAMKRAGVNTNAALLRTLAEEALRRSSINVSSALGWFTEEIRDAGGIMAELVSYATTEDLARAYLEGVAADMRGEFAPKGETQKIEESSAHGENDSRLRHGALSSVADQNAEDGSVFPVSAGHHLARSSVPPGGGEPTFAPNASHGLARPPSGRPRSLADVQAMKGITPKSVYESYRLRDGRMIGSLRWSEIPRYIGANARETAVLRQIHEYANPVADPNILVDRLVPPEVLERMIQKAAEISDAA